MAFQLRCPHCGQDLETETECVGVELECPSCGEHFVASEKPNPKPVLMKVSSEVKTNVRQGAVIGGWVCFALAVILMFVSLWTFFIYGPLLLAAFILSIVAMSQKRVLWGLVLLLFTVVVAPIILIGLGVTRTAKTMQDVTDYLQNPPITSSLLAPSTPVVTGRLGTATKSMDEKNAYIRDFIDLYDFAAKYYDTFTDKQVPGIEFKLRNRGTRTLNEVKVTVYFKDATGKTIAEEDYYPVLVSQFSLSDSKPLKPGYIWQMERGKFYQAKSVPTEWKEGDAEARITDIDFAEEEK